MEEFIAAHEPQLKSINFPPSLYEDLYQRMHNLHHEEKRVEEAFEIRKLPNTSRSMLMAKNAVTAHDTFYLIDHIWKNDGGKTAFERLEKTPELTEKLASMFNVPPPTDAIPAFDFTNEINLLAAMSDKTLKDVEEDLKESDYDTIAALVRLLDKDENANETTPPPQMEEKKKQKKNVSLEEFKKALKYSGHTSGNENDAYIQKMYENFLLEADGHGNTLHYNWSDDGTAITVFVSIPPTARKQAITSTLTVNTWKLVVNGVQLLKGDLWAAVKPGDSMWAIESPGVLSMTLEKVMGGNVWPELLRGEVLLSQDTIFSTSFVKANSAFLYLREVCDQMWTYNQTYSLMSQEGAKVPVWYVMDEHGCALTHGGPEANFQCSPFFNLQTGATFNLLWPVKNVAAGGMCTRNFIPHIMPQESATISKTRLKAFSGRKIYTKAMKEEKEEEDKEKEEEDLKVEIIHNVRDSAGERSDVFKSLSSSVYKDSVSDDMCTALKLSLCSSEQGGDLSLLTLKEVSITLDGDVLPANEIITNKSFLQSYVGYQFEQHAWFQHNYILPRDLDDFAREVESSDVPWVWCVKQVDARQVDVPMVLTTQYSRVVRMCEAGPIAVSKFIKDQPQFRHRRFTLTYSVVLDKTSSHVFILKEPLIHQSADDYDPNEFVDEYDPSNDIITKRHDTLVAQQDTETFKDFQAAMNKLLLPRDENFGWDKYQDTLLKPVGVLARTMLNDIVVPEQQTGGGGCCVVFGVDVLVDSTLAPLVVDVNGVCNPPTKKALQDILRLLAGQPSEAFVQVK